MKWLVKLQGREDNIRELSNFLNTPEACIVQDGQELMLIGCCPCRLRINATTIVMRRQIRMVRCGTYDHFTSLWLKSAFLQVSFLEPICAGRAQDACRKTETCNSTIKTQ